MSAMPKGDIRTRRKIAIYSITSSARASSVGGMVRPSALAIRHAMPMRCRRRDARGIRQSRPRDDANRHLAGYRVQSGRGKSSSALRCPVSARGGIRLVYYLVSLTPCRQRRKSIGKQCQQIQSRLPLARRRPPAVDEALMSAKATRMPAADMRSGRHFQITSLPQPPS